MTAQRLDYSSLEKAIATLKIAIDSYNAMKGSIGPQERDVMRDGVIQRFEYTFELAWKTIRRYLEIYGLEKADTLNNRELFRAGSENGLIKDAATWFDYLADRNQTSHIYDPDVAADVFSSAEAFLADAGYLLLRLKERVK
jgi:nucleotidyltransferase substrate binding protein (TIGR01987 family)